MSFRLIKFIFVAPPNPAFDSLSVPLSSVLTTHFEQPVFGSNFLAFDIKPARDGGLTEGTKAEVRLKDRGLFQLVAVLEKTRERAIYMKRQADSEADTLRGLFLFISARVTVNRDQLFAALYDSTSAARTPEPIASTSRTPQPPMPEPGELPPGYDA